MTRQFFLDVLDNAKKYKNQGIFVVEINKYIYLVPFVENGPKIFLKTIFPSRKMTKKYLGGAIKMKRYKLDKEETKLLKSVEKGEWKNVKNLEFEKKKYGAAAKNTLKIRKDQRISIRLTSSVLEGIKKRSMTEGIPYQTLISSILYKYVFSRSGVHPHFK